LVMKNESDNMSSQKREVLIVRDFKEIEAIRHTWEKLHFEESYPRINADIDRYLTTLKASDRTIEPYIIVLKENGRPTAMLIGMVDKNYIKCTVGRRTLFKPELRRLSVVYGGIIGEKTEQTSRALVGELMKELHSGQVDVVYFNCLETGSPIYRAACEIPGLLSRCHLPKIEVHWRMTLPKDIGSFYKGLSGKHASNLRRLISKLEKAYPNKVKVVTYRQQAELDAAIKAVSEISATTYQYAYGLGVVDNNQTRTVLSQAAQLGWLQIDILYINSEPAAFQLAMKYGNTYFGDKIGFNPKWEKFRIGTVLFLKVTETLCADPPVKYYDFGFGDAKYKSSYCDTEWAEAHVYIFARRVFPVFVNLVLSIALAISVLTKKFVTKLGIHNPVQRLRRKRILEKVRRAKANQDRLEQSNS
jgi:hypothetical protein